MWYSSWENIKKFYDKEEYGEEKEKRREYEENLKNQNLARGNKNNINSRNIINQSESKFDITTKDNLISTKEEKLSDDKKNDETSEEAYIEDDDRERIEQFSGGKSLYEIIYRLKHNTDLNELITRINQDLRNQFDKNKMKIVLNTSEFDKFDEAKDYPDLKATIYYNLE